MHTPLTLVDLESRHHVVYTNHVTAYTARVYELPSAYVTLEVTLLRLQPRFRRHCDVMRALQMSAKSMFGGEALSAVVAGMASLVLRLPVECIAHKICNSSFVRKKRLLVN